LLRLLLRRLTFGARLRARSRSATTATPSFAAAQLLRFRCGGGRLLRRLLLLRRPLLLRPLLLLRTLRSRLLLRFLRLLRLSLLLGSLHLRLRLLSSAPTLALRWPISAPRPFLARGPLFTLRGFAGPLLELADLALHVPLRLLFLPVASHIVTAIRAALPPLGIRTLAGRAENGFRERHLRIGAHCTLRVWTTIAARRCSR
jgi:hypothetical protein